MPTPTPDTSPANIARVLRPFAHFWRQWKRRPISNIDDEFYAIHIGTATEASLRRSDLMAASDLLDALDAQAAVTWEERIDATGLRLMPTAWPQMTEKERDVYRERWSPIITAAFPELAPADD